MENEVRKAVMAVNKDANIKVRFLPKNESAKRPYAAAPALETRSSLLE